MKTILQLSNSVVIIIVIHKKYILWILLVENQTFFLRDFLLHKESNHIFWKWKIFAFDDKALWRTLSFPQMKRDDLNKMIFFFRLNFSPFTTCLSTNSLQNLFVCELKANCCWRSTPKQQICMITCDERG